MATVVATAPAAPTALAATVADREVTFTWTAPADGGSPLTGYQLVLNDGTPIEIEPDLTQFSLTLGEGTYEAVLTATNEVGQSEASEPTADITVLPEAPNVEPTEEAVAISAPVDDGGTGVAATATLGGLLLVGGGLLGWWWVRKRRATAAPETLETFESLPV